MSHIPPTYIPPYDSPLEDAFAYQIVKYLSESVTFVSQVEFRTICGTFRVDFVAYAQSGDKIAFECDGKDFHHEGRDEWRDAMILGDRHVDFIYRLRGSDIHYHMDDVLYAISMWNPEIFTLRGLKNLHVLASDKAKEPAYKDDDTVHIAYSPDLHTVIERRCISETYLTEIYKFANQIGGGNLDRVIAEYKSQILGDDSFWDSE